MQKFLAFALATTLLAIVPLDVSADNHCDRPDAIAVGDLYIDDRGDPTGTGLITGGGTWLYQESNGNAGLQLSGDTVSLLGEADGFAAGCTDGDTLLI